MKNVETTLYGAIRNAAGENPERTALLYMGRNITYRRMLEEIELFACGLSSLGIGRGSVVTVCMPNTPESVFALYAASKLGAVAHLVHPLAPAHQLEQYMAETGGKLVVLLGTHVGTHAAMLAKNGIAALVISPAESLGAAKFRLYGLMHRQERTPDSPLCVCWHDLRRKMKNADLRTSDAKNLAECEAPASSAEPADMKGDSRLPAIYLHSGGTSGSPKTIAISSFAINSLSQNASYILNRTRFGDLCMHAVLPMFHGFGLCMGVHAMLAHGGCDTLMPKFDARETIRLIRRGRLHILIGVPALFEALLARREFRGGILKNLSAAFVGGDFVSHELIERFDRRMEEAGAPARLFEGYGLTEVVTVCAVNTAQFNRAGTVGKPLPDLRMKIAGSDGSELERGTPGEIYVSGDERMNGYLNDPDCTAKVLARDAKGTVWVRTGDFGSMDEEGYVKFLSRIKRIVKVSGISVFPSEIEQIAVRFPEVEAACALGVPDARHGNVIALFVQIAAGSDSNGLEERIRREIREQLSIYALPKRVFCLAEMPRTAVGKADAAALEQIWKRSLQTESKKSAAKSTASEN